MKEYLRVGIITSTHGLKGEVKVFPTTDSPDRFEDLDEVWIGDGTRMKKVSVNRVKYFKQFVILSFRGIEVIEEVQPYVKQEIYVSREDALPLEEDEYYVADLIGLRVISDEDEDLGRLKDVLETGANDVYLVEKEGKELLIPAIHECILDVDLDKGCVTVHLMEGLR